MALTIFSIPKPFTAQRGHIGVIQRNAIASWTALPADVVLFGDDDGVAEAARGFGVHHEPRIARNESGTPLVSDAFDRVRELAKSDCVAHVNADIVLTSDFVRALEALRASPLSQWMMIGQRYDLDVREPIAIGNGWEDCLRRDVAARGTLHGKSGIDFFAFPRTLPVRLPPLAIGRVGWDSWLIYATRSAGIPLVDATRIVCIVHQNHAAAYDPAGREADENRASAGGYYRMGTIRDADWQLEREGARIAIRPRPAGRLWFSPPVRAGLAIRRALSRRFTGSRI